MYIVVLDLGSKRLAYGPYLTRENAQSHAESQTITDLWEVISFLSLARDYNLGEQIDS